MILEGTTSSGAVVPVQVTDQGRVVAEGLQGPEGPAGPQGPEGPPGPAGGYWERTGTVVSPSNAGDGITTTGDLQAASVTATGAGAFGSLTGRTTSPAAGQIGEVVTTSMTFTDHLFTQNVQQTFTFPTALAMTPGVWRIEAECRFDSTYGVAGHPTVGNYLQYKFPALTRTGTEVSVQPMPSVASVSAFTNPGQTSVSTTIGIIGVYSTNASVTQAGVNVLGWQNNGTAYASFRLSGFIRALATRIA